MNPTTLEVARQCLQDSFAGSKSFGQIVMTLDAAGVESYYADYRGAATTYYQGTDAARLPHVQHHEHAIPDSFDAGALQAAIRGAQRGEVKYPEFLRLSMTAGCVGYLVWIKGRHVSYFGRRGEVHIEPFPS